MAVGDAIVGLSATVANDGYMDIQPSGTDEWSIHNIFWEDDVEIYWYDGTNSIKFHSATENGGLLNYVIEVTNLKYVRVKNISGSTQNLGYSGRQIG